MSSSEARPSPDRSPARQVRFGLFEFDLDLPELRRNGRVLRLQDQPARLLVILVDRAGQLVTREELREQLWPADTFVEFDASLNTAVRKIRQALDDSAENPRFVETVPRKGYRFIAPVQAVPTVSPAVARPVLVMPKPEPEPAGVTEELIEDEPLIPEPAVVSVPEATPPSRRSLLLAGAGAAGLAAAGAWWRWAGAIGAPARHGGTPVDSSFDLPPGLFFTHHLFGTTLAISADGSTLAFVLVKGEGGPSMIYVRGIGEQDFQMIPGSEAAHSIAVSPDGRAVLFRKDHYLVRADRESGEVRRLAPVLDGPEEQIWGKDGMVYYSSPVSDRTDALTTVWRVPADGSKPAERLLGDDQPDLGALWILPLQLMPDRRHLLVSRFRSARRMLGALDLKSLTVRPLADNVNGGTYLPTGHLVHHRSTILYAQRMNAETLAVSGAPVVVRRDVVQASWSGGNLSIADNGTLVYQRKEREVPDRIFVWVDMAGRETPVGFPPGPYEPVEVSPDGSHVLVRRFDPTEGNWSLWHMGLKTGEWHQLFVASEPAEAVWTPDGQSVIAGVPEKGLVRLPAFSKAEPVVLNATNLLAQCPAPMNRGQDFVLFTEGYHPKVSTIIRVVRADGTGRPENVLESHFQPALSPDGKWLATATALGVHVQPFPVVAGAPVLDVGPGISPQWAPDGRSIIWLHGRRLMTARFTPDAVVKMSDYRTILEDDFIPPTRWLRRLAFSKADRRILIARNGQPEPPLRTVRTVTNWFTEVQRLYPPL